MDAIVPTKNSVALSPYKTVNISIKLPNPAVNRASRKRAAGYVVRQGSSNESPQLSPDRALNSDASPAALARRPVALG